MISKQVNLFNILVPALFLFGLLPRIVSIFQPIAGDFASYQMDNIWFAHFIVEEGVKGFLYPKSMIIANGQPLLVLLSLPLPALAAAFGKMLFGGNLEIWGHIQAVLFNTLSTFLFFLIVKRLTNYKTAIVAALILWFSPIEMVYGSKFFNEPLALFLLLGGFYLTFLVQRDNKRSGFFLIASGILIGLSIAVRPYFALTLPAYFYLLYRGYREGRISIFLSLLCLVAMAIPELAWTYHIGNIVQQGGNISANYYLQSQIQDRFSLNSLVSIYKSRIFLETLFDDFLWLHYTPIIIPFLLIGLFRKANGYFFHIWLSGIILLVLLIPQKICDHSFYAYPFIPAGCVLAALGLVEVYENNFMNFGSRKEILRSYCVIAIIAFAVVLTSLRFSIPKLFFYTSDEASAIKMGRIVDKKIPKDSYLVSAKKDGSPVFFYYCNRPGWVFDLTRRERMTSDKESGSSFFVNYQEKLKSYLSLTDVDRIESYRKQGGKYLTLFKDEKKYISKELAEHLQKSYRIISASEDPVIIYQLN